VLKPVLEAAVIAVLDVVEILLLSETCVRLFLNWLIIQCMHSFRSGG
jgi:hypothetical protein